MTGSAQQLVWDLPTRLFHWTLALALPLCWWTAEYGHMAWHRRLGLAVCFLIVFRIAWGVIGMQTSRFAYFVKGPRVVLQYLRGSETNGPVEVPGHSPLGALSVIAMIAAIAAQVTLGLFAVDVDGLESGPLSGLVSYGTGRTAARLHHLIFNGLLALVILHILAIAFYVVVRRRRLVRPMITGSSPVPDRTFEAILPASRRRLMIAAGFALGVTYSVSTGFSFG